MTSNSNLNPFAALFESEHDIDNNVTVTNEFNNNNNLEAQSSTDPVELAPKPKARKPLQCHLEKDRRKPCPYHPFYFENNIRTNGKPCQHTHRLTPRCPKERKGVICQGHFPQLGPEEQQCPFYHKPETVEMPQVVETIVPVIETKTLQKCPNEVKFGFCGFHPALYSNVSPPRGSPCPKLHERMPPCPTQRNGAQCMAENCGFFHKKAYNNNILETTQQARPTVASDLFVPRTRQQIVHVPSPIQVIYVGPPVARANRHFDVPLPKICLTNTNMTPV
jgi:hypothetical protein